MKTNERIKLRILVVDRHGSRAYHGQIRRQFGDANLWGKLTEFYVVLAVILINYTYVANPYQ